MENVLLLATTSTPKLDVEIEKLVKEGKITFDGKQGEDAADEFMFSGDNGINRCAYHRLGFAIAQIVNDGEMLTLLRRNHK